MKSLSVFVLVASLLAAPAQASENASRAAPEMSQAVLSSDTRADPAALNLARELVGLVYPVSDTIDAMRTGWMDGLATIESVSMRSIVKQEYERTLDRLEPIIVRHFPKIQDAYAGAYAQEFTVAELRDLVAFANSSTGRHFLKDTNFADFDERVLEANEGMTEDLEPVMMDLRKALCEQKTQARIAQGETDAKCPLA